MLETDAGFVGDHKTARYSAGKDYLLPQYRGQLLGYAFLMEKNNYKKPQNAALFYMGPPADPSAEELLSYIGKNGFTLPFSVEVVPIELGDFKLIMATCAPVRAFLTVKCRAHLTAAIRIVNCRESQDRTPFLIVNCCLTKGLAGFGLEVKPS